MSTITKLSTLALVAVFAVACSDQPAPAAPEGGSTGNLGFSLVPADPTGDNTLTVEHFEVCKFYTEGTGPDLVVQVDVDIGNDGGSDATHQVTLAGTGMVADACQEVWLQGGTSKDKVTVTEVTDLSATYTTSVARTFILDGTPGGPDANKNGLVDGDSGVLLVFTNTLIPPQPGRMTGGGSFFNSGRFTHGFELHCDPNNLPNNLEVNWQGSSNQFHLTSLTSVACTDDPALNPLPRPAPFDTYMGTGVGTLNGVPGATIVFTFTDDGEPGTSDFADISITPPGGGTPITASGLLRFGNHQAHPDN